MAKLTPEVACKILRKMGLISNSDNGYFEMAMQLYQLTGDVEGAAEAISKERRKDLYGDEE